MSDEKLCQCAHEYELHGEDYCAGLVLEDGTVPKTFAHPPGSIRKCQCKGFKSASGGADPEPPKSERQAAQIAVIFTDEQIEKLAGRVAEKVVDMVLGSGNPSQVTRQT